MLLDPSWPQNNMIDALWNLITRKDLTIKASDKGGILWICIPLIMIKCVWNKNWYKKLTIAECALWPVISMFWLVGFLFKTDLGIHLNFTSTGGLFLHVSWKAQNVIQTPWSTHCIWKLMPHGECKLVYRFHFATLCNYYCILFTRFDTSIKKCLAINLNGCLIGSFTWQIWQTMVGISVMFFVCPPCCRGTQCMLCITVTCHPSTVPGMSGSCAALPPLHTCADSLWVRVPSPMMLYPHDCCSTDPFTSRCMRGLTLLSRMCVSGGCFSRTSLTLHTCMVGVFHVTLRQCGYLCCIFSPACTWYLGGQALGPGQHI